MDKEYFNNTKIEYEIFFKKQMIKHFYEFRRDFPWRIERSPYKVLISEVLLQKTNAEKVVEVYNLMISKFPEVCDLARADYDWLSSVMKPLGLFNRAERLITISEIIMTQHNGLVPSSIEELKKLKGVGDYTANAIMAFGFGVPVAILDINVIRILGRFFGIYSNISRPHTDKEMWKVANKILFKKMFVDYNYALLDFSSKICKANKPQCDICFLKEKCKYCGENSKMKVLIEL